MAEGATFMTGTAARGGRARGSWSSHGGDEIFHATANGRKDVAEALEASADSAAVADLRPKPEGWERGVVAEPEKAMEKKPKK